MRRLLILTLIGIPLAVALLVGCKPKQQATPDLSGLINSAVQATIAAMPQATAAPLPTTASTADLSGLFCEYEFCIGHPSDVPLFDAKRESNVAEFSTYGAGRVAGYRQDLFVLAAWVGSSGAWDPGGLMKTMQAEFGVSPTGDYKIDLIQQLNVAYQPITPPGNSVFTGGLSAAWRCGDRDFIWMAFTTTENQANAILSDALAKFRCGSP
jgi:hypothetical protein